MTVLLARERLQSGVSFNPLSPAVIANPYPFYQRLREQDRVHWSALANGWLLFGYHDVAEAVRDHHRFSSDLRHDPRMLARVPITETPSLLAMDPPDHTRLRALVNKTFTPRAVQAMQPRIDKLVSELLDAVHGTGSFDLMQALAIPLPIIVIAEMLGIPTQDRVRFREWSTTLARTIEPGHPAQVRAHGQRAAIALSAYFRDVISRRRRQPGPDLMSQLIAAEEAGDRLSEAEMVAMLRVLLIAGNETTTNLIGNGMLALLERPDELATLRHNPDLMDDTIEELLRFDSPVQLDRRFAATELELGGKRIRPRQRVFPVLGAANRDPAVFPDPDRLDLGRSDKRHMSFGRGIHHCLGAALARLEGSAALRGLLDRFPRLALDHSGAGPEFRPQLLLRGLHRLPVRTS